MPAHGRWDLNQRLKSYIGSASQGTCSMYLYVHKCICKQRYVTVVILMT